ncbi:hypothetical protein KC717_06025 [Candidatus Dojkabacteria bacterium]|uniref:Phage tail protein n=1 Tax=Candidatus Dojkabacteria bacterium TaxID=2099670 RepID=A0A955L9T9_9BACT|nr:hypothetical protein [Candidatus Dojkabacteria bacterium]
MANILGGGGSGAVRLLFPAITGSEITNWDADTVDLTGITSLKIDYANKRKSTEYESERTIRGVNVRAAKKDKTLDAVTGTIVAAEGQASSVEIGFYANDAILSKVKAAVGSSDQPVIAIWAGGEVDGGLPKDYHLLGYIDGNLAEEYKEGVQTYTIKIAGGVGFTEDDGSHTGYIAAFKTTPGLLAADGFDDTTEAVTLTDVTAGNVTTLLSGEILEVTRA